MSVVGRVFGFVNKPLVGSRFSNILESEMCFVDSGFSREVPKKKKKKTAGSGYWREQNPK